MIEFKPAICPYCGGELRIPINIKIINCMYCGKQITFENLNNDQTIKDTDTIESISNVQTTDKEIENKPKKKFKAIYIISIIVIIVLIGSGLAYKFYLDNENAKKKQAEETYITNFNVVVIDIVGQTTICEMYSNEVSKVWGDAIDNGKDFNVEISNWISFLDSKGQMTKINSSKDDINNKMRFIQTPITGYEESYKLLIELYGNYSHICSQVISPTGSLISYNQDVNKTVSDFNTIFDKLTIMIPTLKATQEVK